MVTTVGLQLDFKEALKDLLELDYDAIEAYKEAIKNIQNDLFKATLTEFCEDHERHVKEISAVLTVHHEAVPTGPDAKQWLTKGKVVLAQLMGDNAILAAMRSNEKDTNTAYERMAQHEGIWPECIDLLRRGLNDERKHKAWFAEKMLVEETEI